MGVEIEATEQISEMGCYPINQQAAPMRSLKTGDEKCFGDRAALKRCVGRPSKFYVAYSKTTNPGHKTFFLWFPHSFNAVPLI